MGTLTPIRGRESRRFSGVIKFAALGVVVFGAVFFLTNARAAAAPYTSPSNLPPQCSPGTVNIPYSFEYYIEKANWSSPTLRQEFLAAYGSGAPAWVFYYGSRGSGFQPQVVMVILDGYTGTSSMTTGVRIPNNVNNAIFMVEDGTRYGRFQMFINSSNTVLDPPGYPPPYVSTITPPSSVALFPGVSSGDSDYGDCVIGVQNVYQYAGIDYFELSEHEAQAENPEQGFWQSVGSFFSDFWDWVESIPQMIYDLFVPNPDTIGVITTDFSDFFSEKLGFLLWPFDFLADLFDLFMGTGISDEYDDFGNEYNWCSSPSWGTGSSIERWSFGQFLGGGVWINPCMFEKSMPSVWTFATIAARATLVFALVAYLLAVYRRHIK